MSAADRREELEALAHHQLTKAWRHGVIMDDQPRDLAQPILAAADRHAADYHAEQLAAMTSGELRRRAHTAEAREAQERALGAARLAIAAAEHGGTP